MARRLAKEEGVFAGTSSALNVVAALQVATRARARQSRRHGRGRHRLKYLAGDLFST